MNKNKTLIIIFPLVIYLLQSLNYLHAFPSLPLGELIVPQADIVGTPFDSSFQDSEAFNGIKNSPSDGWRGLTTQNGSLRWDVAPTTPNIGGFNNFLAIWGYDTIKFTLRIYNGGATSLNNIGNLEQFQIRVLEQGRPFSEFQVVTDFGQLHSKGIGTGEDLSISADSNGLITATPSASGVQSMHTIVFSVPSDVRTIQIITTPSSSVESHFSIDEIETFGVAVPEPSTYGLLLGGFLLLIGLVRRIRIHGNAQLEK